MAEDGFPELSQVEVESEGPDPLAERYYPSMGGGQTDVIDDYFREGVYFFSGEEFHNNMKRTTQDWQPLYFVFR